MPEVEPAWLHGRQHLSCYIIAPAPIFSFFLFLKIGPIPSRTPSSLDLAILRDHGARDGN